MNRNEERKWYVTVLVFCMKAVWKLFLFCAWVLLNAFTVLAKELSEAIRRQLFPNGR